MSDDLIERLRYYGYPAFEPFCNTANEAADKIERLTAEREKALPVARELDCMLASHAKSKRAYEKMQGQAEYIVEALQGDSDE